MADLLRLATPDIHLHRVMLSKHRRGPWSSAEDSCLLDLVRTQGASNWVRISQMIGTRSPKQCRERFHQNLKPSLNLDPITPEEGVLIERMVAEMGKRWAEIARRLHGRSDNAVKNWWNGGMNRRKRLDNRRAEVAPRQHHHAHHQHHHHGMQYHHQQPPYEHYAQHQPAYAHSYPPPQPQQSAHSYHSVSPTTTQHAIVNTNRGYDQPLPSPGAFSTVSRAESADAPPSMVSDISYSSFPNPTTPPQASTEQLPPLSLIDSRYSKSHHSRSSPPSSYSIPTSSYTTSTKPYPLLAERWSEPSSASSTAPRNLPYTGPQLPLPSFSSIVGQHAERSNSPNGLTKDGRMDVSKLIH